MVYESKKLSDIQIMSYLQIELYAANNDIFYELINYSHSSDTMKNRIVGFHILRL